MSEPATILVVEDDRPLQDALVSTLVTAGYKVLAASDGGEALKLLADNAVDLVVSDVQMQPVDGAELLRRLRQKTSPPPVLLMTAYGTIDRAVAAMRDGAVDYLVKPFEAEELERRVARFARPASSAAARLGVEPIAEDPRSRALLDLAARVARSDVTVLLTGESGTGKEVYARFIHSHSKRSGGPFVAVNCAAIPDQMLEALLFGHEKGAFTGAQARSPGKFVQANGGTILLDEITEMDLSLQAKLLRVLQEREVEPLGASKPVPLDVRVLATSNRDLEQTVRDGEFREDLYYRLSVFPLQIPPLRERPGDVAELARRFVAARGGAYTLTEVALTRLAAHSWPGNVRELENVMQRALLLCDSAGAIEPRHLVLDERARVAPTGPAPVTSAGVLGAALGGLADELWEEETRRIVTALASSHGREQAAQQLGISGRTLRYKLSKMRKAGIQVPGDRA
ncbi:MAG TPA: sigma-54 dependent transcriptional regulator [Gammaproteobacteria bacterium]|nr:sigma-54 dependent transcriptional regulator [Gammaproteobacteria bacterium]